MKRSELIELLMSAAPPHEDPEVLVDAVPDGLLHIDDVDVNMDEDGIVIWVK